MNDDFPSLLLGMDRHFVPRRFCNLVSRSTQGELRGLLGCRFFPTRERSTSCSVSLTERVPAATILPILSCSSVDWRPRRAFAWPVVRVPPSTSSCISGVKLDQSNEVCDGGTIPTDF